MEIGSYYTLAPDSPYLLKDKTPDEDLATAVAKQQENANEKPVNESSNLYFELSEDISEYQISKEDQALQNQTESDVMMVVDRYTGEDGYFTFYAGTNGIYSFLTEEGQEILANAYGYDIANPINHAAYQNASSFKEQMQYLSDWAEFEKLRYSADEAGIAQSDFLSKYSPDNYPQSADSTRVYSNFHYKSENDIEVGDYRESFKNLYRISENIDKDTFKRLYGEYMELVTPLLESTNLLLSWKQSDSFLDAIHSEIPTKGFSKAQWMEYFENNKSELSHILEINPNLQEKMKRQIEKHIDYFDNLTTDLKELWNYGDLDIAV